MSVFYTLNLPCYLNISPLTKQMIWPHDHHENNKTFLLMVPGDARPALFKGGNGFPPVLPAWPRTR